MNFKIQHLDSGVVLLVVAGQVTVPEAREALEHAEREYRTWTEPRSIAYDVHRTWGVGADVRRLLTDWRTKNGALIAAAIHGGAYVVPSSVLRGIVTALNWVKPSGIRRVAYCETRMEAIAKCESWNQERAATSSTH